MGRAVLRHLALLAGSSYLCTGANEIPSAWSVHPLGYPVAADDNSGKEHHECTVDQPGAQQMWSERRQKWCCKHRGVACHGDLKEATNEIEDIPASSRSTTVTSYDCVAGFAHWKKLWSEPKRKACCARYNRACLTTMAPFDCDHGVYSWKIVWSIAKKTWCCQQTGDVGCDHDAESAPTTDAPTTTAASTLPSTLTKTRTRTTSPEPTQTRTRSTTTRSTTTVSTTTSTEQVEELPSEQVEELPSEQVEELPSRKFHSYDCLLDVWNWMVSWTPAKRAFCCTKHGLGCEAASESPTALTTSAAPFDCFAAFVGWQTSWSVIKKEWCCLNYKRGCPPTGGTAGAVSANVVGTAKTVGALQPTATPPIPPPETPVYDCSAGSDEMATTWSDGKRQWCCQHKGRGCIAAETPHTDMQGKHVATTSLPYDCSANEDSMEDWSDGKKAWCCLRDNKGCPEKQHTTQVNFDCKDDVDHWLNAWSIAKRNWCCQNDEELAGHAACLLAQAKFEREVEVPVAVNGKFNALWAVSVLQLSGVVVVVLFTTTLICSVRRREPAGPSSVRGLRRSIMVSQESNLEDLVGIE